VFRSSKLTQLFDSLGRIHGILLIGFASNVSASCMGEVWEDVRLTLLTFRNLVYIGIFSTVALCLTLDAASCFAVADGNVNAGTVLHKFAGAWGFAAGLLGYYALAHYLFKCESSLPLGIDIPLGNTSRYFARVRNHRGRKRSKIPRTNNDSAPPEP
jgi:hypothetical protein